MGTLCYDMCTVTVIFIIWTSSGAHPFFFCRGEVARAKLTVHNPV